MATRSTKTTKSTAKTKASAPKKVTAKVAPKATVKPVVAKATPAAPKATVIETVKPVVAGAPVKKPELIDRVMAETGMKKKDVKPVVEAMLAVMGKALASGEELNVPPLGKVMVNRMKDVANAKILNVKIRHPQKAENAGKDPLAQAAE